MPNENNLIDIEALGNKIIQDLTDLAELAPQIQTVEDLEAATWPSGSVQTFQDRLAEVNSAWTDKLTVLESNLETRRTEWVAELTAWEAKLTEVIEGRLQLTPSAADKYTFGGYVRDSQTSSTLPFLALEVKNPEHDFVMHTATNELGTFKVDIDAETVERWGDNATLTVSVIDERGQPQTDHALQLRPVVGQAETVTVAVQEMEGTVASRQLSSSMVRVATKFAGNIRYRSNTIDSRLLTINKAIVSKMPVDRP